MVIAVSIVISKGVVSASGTRSKAIALDRVNSQHICVIAVSIVILKGVVSVSGTRSKAIALDRINSQHFIYRPTSTRVDGQTWMVKPLPKSM
jgi:hypothetical protein